MQSEPQLSAAKRGRPRKVEQGSMSTPDSAKAAPVEHAQGLAGFIAAAEDARSDVVLTLVSHPDADGAVFQGRYSGIRTIQGPVAVTYSDGTTS